MEDQLILSGLKPAKHEGQISIRIKNYTRIYSARPSSCREPSKPIQKTINTSKISKPSPSVDMSRFSFRPENMKNLEKLSKSLLYEVQKASSDRLELIRDLSTYDYNFSNAVNLKQKLETFINLSFLLPEGVNTIKHSTNNEKNCFEQIKSGLIKISGLNEEACEVGEFEPEGILVRNIDSAHIFNNVFKGVCFISGAYAVVSLTADQWLEYLNFKVTLLDSQLVTLQIKQRISNNCYTPEQINFEIKNKILPFLYFKAESMKIRLKFSKKHNKDNYVILVHVKGFQLCNVIASTKSDTQTLLEIPELEQSIFIHQSCDFSDEASIKRLVALIKSQLFYSASKKTLLWGSAQYFFSTLEKSSKFLNEDFIKSATLPIGNFSHIYTFHIDQQKISCYSDKSKIILKFFRGNSTEELQNDSKNFGFLECMQDIDIKSSPVTLSKSLELEFLLSKLFP